MVRMIHCIVHITSSVICRSVSYCDVKAVFFTIYFTAIRAMYIITIEYYTNGSVSSNITYVVLYDIVYHKMHRIKLIARPSIRNNVIYSYRIGCIALCGLYCMVLVAL